MNQTDTAVRPILDMNAFDATQASSNHQVSRRLNNLGAASVLFYRQPIEMVTAQGCWMTAADGSRYLDFYNNVPSVGHCHPKVIEAVTEQMSRLNTNTRYLVAVVDDYLDALKAKLPDALANVVMTCSGSEANDLAMRIARKVSGGTGFIVTEAAYHGNTALVTEVSPSAFRHASLPDHVVAIPAPSALVYGNDIATGFANAVRAAVKTLAQRGHRPAALLVDSIFSSDGVFAQPAGFLQAAVDAIHQAGGLYIADEVQPGFGRLGDAFWGFDYHGVQPDLVTMGKPMGNGFPMAAMASRPEYLAAFCEDTGYFNTFGGNPVAAAAGLAVLKVLEQQGLQHNARDTGYWLQQQLNQLAAEHHRITDVRGSGLFIGVDLGAEDDPTRPDPVYTVQIINRMRDAGVLIGAAGKHAATLKVRPPLCLTRNEAQQFVDALSAALTTD
ncbi:aspartate aminotransferase family protein [Candidatus Thalassolituus haligoni]|jgi:4-aminobutyrate aminotransferase-like enzyme|uniref:aspartate aminotransferase family protein n=1 Tax=Candidatus Thalassolituus haligoni TaxID=3100113 RepID=UPI003516F412